MRISNEKEIDLMQYEGIQRRMLDVLRNVPFFIRRYFVIEYTPNEEAILEHFTKDTISEHLDISLQLYSLRNNKDSNEIIMCFWHFDVRDGHEEEYDALEAFLDRRRCVLRESIDYDIDINFTNMELAEASSVKYIEDELLPEVNRELDAKIKADEVRLAIEKSRSDLEYLVEGTKAYEAIDVDFLAE